MKINLSIEMLQRRSISQLQALLDTGDDWLKPQTLTAVRQILESKLKEA